MMNKLRIFIVLFVISSISLPMVWVSFGKFLLFVFGLIFLVFQILQNKTDNQLKILNSTRIIIAIMMCFTVGIIWTEAPLDIGLLALVKHGKIFEIILLVYLIKSTHEAKLALRIFIISQAIFIVSSWLMVADWRIPWATSEQVPEFKYVVYSTYLDQTLIFAATSGVFWSVRDVFRSWRWVLICIAALGISNNLLFQNGKTGFLVSCAVIALLFIFEFPKKIRWFAVLVFPVLVIGVTYTASEKFQHKVSQVITEAQDYSSTGSSSSSSGFRLHAWKRSIEAISEKPIQGHGVGSWTIAVKQLEGSQGDVIFGTGLTSNPHQEYLMWGVELGLIGLALLLLFIYGLLKDASGFPTPIKHSVILVVTVMAIACLFNSSLYDALIGDFFCVTLGMLLAFGLRSQIDQDGQLKIPQTISSP